MNCDRTRCLVFLLESGELTGRRRRQVEKHLEMCPECASFCSEAGNILSAAGRSLDSVDGPSPFVMTRIRAHAREAVLHRPVIFTRPVVQLAAAALLMILAAGWWSLLPSERADPEASRIGDIHTIISIVSDEEYVASEQKQASREVMLQDLAEQLLQMEGLAEEEFSVEEFLAPQATAPQSHSIREPVSRRRV